MDNDQWSEKSGGAEVAMSQENSADQARDDTGDHAQVVLLKMEAANRQIETDAKSAVSILQQQSSNSSPERKAGANESSDELEHWSAWAALVQEWNANTKKNKDMLRDMTKKGIPQPLRAIAWQLLANAVDNPLKNDYVSLIVKNGPFDKAIQRDLARTFPNHEFFKSKPKRSELQQEQNADPNESRTSTMSLCEGQESLFNVLKAYSLVDREVGYCQGSAFIAGLLLLQLPEEESFCVFAKLMQEYRLRELYKPAMTELGLCIFQLENLLQEHMPKLYIHLTSIGFHTTIFATSWFLTLFNTTFTLDVCFRLMDLFLLDGMDVVFRVALAILLLSEQDLLQLDMEGANNYMQTLSSTYHGRANKLIKVAYDPQKVRINSRSMKKWEKEFISIQNKQEEEQIEMRRLRTETKLLRQRLEYLERENERIADALVQYQLSTAEATDEINRLRTQLRRLNSPSVSLNVTMNPPESSNFNDCRTSCPDGHNAAYSKETRLLIDELQSELVTSRLKEAELNVLVREQKDRLAELEEENRNLLRKPKSEVFALQDELISVKLREAETNLNLKDLELKLNNVQKLWKARDQLVAKTTQSETAATVESPTGSAGSSQSGGKSKISNSASFSFGFLSSLSGIGQSGNADNSTTRNVIELQDELISSRLKEAEAAAELRSMQKRVMELESQTQLLQRQLARVEDENGELRERAAEHESVRKRVASDCRTLEMRLAEAETREKQKDVQFRILEVELRAQLSDLEARLAANEIHALENTVTNSYSHKLPVDSSQMYVSTMSTSVFDPDSFRLQLTQSVYGDLEGESGFSALSATDNKQPLAALNDSNAVRLPAASSTTVSKASIPTLERVQQIMERVSPYEKYGRLASAAIDNEAE